MDCVCQLLRAGDTVKDQVDKVRTIGNHDSLLTLSAQRSAVYSHLPPLAQPPRRKAGPLSSMPRRTSRCCLCFYLLVFPSAPLARCGPTQLSNSSRALLPPRDGRRQPAQALCPLFASGLPTIGVRRRLRELNVHSMRSGGSWVFRPLGRLDTRQHSIRPWLMATMSSARFCCYSMEHKRRE